MKTLTLVLLGFLSLLTAVNAKAQTLVDGFGEYSTGAVPFPWDASSIVTDNTNVTIINTSSSPANPSGQSMQSVWVPGQLSNQGANLYYMGIVGLQFNTTASPASLQNIFAANPSYNAIAADVQLNWTGIPDGATYSVELGFKSNTGGDYWLVTALPTTGMLVNSNGWTTLTWTLTPSQVALIKGYPTSPSTGELIFALRTSIDITSGNTMTVGFDNIKAFNGNTGQNPFVATLPTATGIFQGQTLASSTLSGGNATNAAGATVPGVFAFTTPSIAPNVAGSTNVSVTFTPSDTTNYNAITCIVNVPVNVVTNTTNTTLIDDFGSYSVGDISLAWPWQLNGVTDTTDGNIIDTDFSPDNTSDQSLQVVFTPGQLSNQGPDLYYEGIVGLNFNNTAVPASLENVFESNPAYNAISADVQFNWQGIPTNATYSVQLGFKTSLGDYWLDTALPTTGTLVNSNGWTRLTWTLTPAQLALIENWPNSPTYGLMVFAIQTSTDVTDTNTITVGFDNIQAFDAIAQPQNPNLQINASSTNVQLTWSSGVLLESTNLAGPWTTNANTSPYVTPASSPQKFYRVKLQ